MSPLAQIGIAVCVVASIAAGLFAATAALLRISPADPGDLEVVHPDGDDQA